MRRIIQKNLPSLKMLYRHLHAHPELSLQEKETSKRIAKELAQAGFKVKRGVGGYGVAGVLKNGSGPAVLVRADMDALPVTETTGLSYASTRRGVMHACGHDVHMTCWVGTARTLVQMKDDWKGTLIFIAQPAEEKGQGAHLMLKAGLFKKFPKPDYALALHVDSQLESGKIGYRIGPAFANVDSVDITVHGRGGHGAYPHLSVDPIVIASEIVMALQTIVAREIRPYETAVITVGSIHAGTKHNIIPNEAKLEITTRSYQDSVRAQILDGIRRIARQTARAHNAPRDPEIRVGESIPSTYNDPALVQRLLPVFRRVAGQKNVIEKDPEMGGEDFGLFGRAGVPACLFRLGSISRKQKRPFPSLHSSGYSPELEPTLFTGIQAMSSAVLELCAAG